MHIPLLTSGRQNPAPLENTYKALALDRDTNTAMDKIAKTICYHFYQVVTILRANECKPTCNWPPGCWYDVGVR